MLQGDAWVVTGNTLGAAAGLLFVAVGAWVLASRPRWSLHLWSAGFSASYGLYLLLSSLGPADGMGALGQGSETAAQAASGAAGLFLMAVARRFPDADIERSLLLRWACLAFLAGAFLNFWFIYAYTVEGRTPADVLGPVPQALLQLWAGFGAFATLFIVAWMAVLGLRDRAIRSPRREALLTLALVPSEGLYYGLYFLGDSHSGALVVLADAVMVAVLLAVGAAWFHLHARHRQRPMLWAGLACFAFPCLGVLAGLPSSGPLRSLAAEGLTGLVGLACAGLLAVLVARRELPGDGLPVGQTPAPVATPAAEGRPLR